MSSEMAYQGFFGKAGWLWRYYRRFIALVVFLLVMTPVQAMLESIVPRMVGFIIDSLRGASLESSALAQTVIRMGGSFGLGMNSSFAVAFMVLGVVSFTLYASVQSTRAWMNSRLEWAFRQDAFDGLTLKGPDFFNRFRIGDIVTRLTDDVAEKLSWFACSGIFRFYEALMKIFFIGLMMIWIDPWLTLCTVSPLPLVISIFVKGGTLLDRRYDRLQKSISDVNDRMEVCFSGVRVVKAYSREAAQREAFGEVAEARRSAEMQAVRAKTVMESMWDSVWQFGVVLVLLAGGWRMLYADLTLGELATFVYYTVWMVFPMFDIGQFMVKSRQSAVSIDRLLELENVAPLVSHEGTAVMDNARAPAIRFRDVSLTFDGAGRDILKDINLDVEAGQTVAVVGRVGSGKSSLLNLIPRVVDPTSGSVLIDGRDVREYSLALLRGAMGFVPQEPSLFSDTIRVNVELGREDIDHATLDWALEVSQLKADIERFPDREETVVGTRGVTLSGGQKQRLALARALAGKPKILILDDCTSALDSRTESALWDRLHEVMPELTTLVVTHRPDTLRHADVIYVLSDGRVVERGTHESLIAQDGEYAMIYRRYRLEELVD